MSDIKVTLTDDEMAIACVMAGNRQIENLREGRIDKYGCSLENAFQTHLDGIFGEMVVAKALNLYWNGNRGNLRAVDVGSFQVRCSQKGYGRLILHHDDSDEDIFILVTGRAPKFAIRGYIKGVDGKKDEFWDDPSGDRGKKKRPAFFVPHDRLHDPTELRRAK